MKSLKLMMVMLFTLVTTTLVTSCGSSEREKMIEEPVQDEINSATDLIEKLEDQLSKSAEKTGISVEELRESYSDLSDDRTQESFQYSNRVQRDVCEYLLTKEELKTINEELLEIGADQVGEELLKNTKTKKIN